MEDTPRIDSHAHVWDATCKIVTGARYSPSYTAPIGQYLSLLDGQGIRQAVLVQPSFLGTDNRYLLDCLAAHPDRLRGIVVVSPDVTDTALDQMHGLGVVGLRYNLVGRDVAEIATPAYRALTQRVTARGWWVEVQAEGPDWTFVLETLLADQAHIMVDHFGKPSGPDCPGLAALLATEPQSHCVKLSAPYRQNDIAKIAQRLVTHFGAERCLWGSDWPWTQHEGQHSYADAISWLDRWTTAEQRALMRTAAPDLCKFTQN